MKRSIASIALLSLVGGVFPIPISHAATPVVDTTISLKKTGSEPFDTEASAGGIGDCTDFSVGSWHSVLDVFPDGQDINDGDNGSPGDDAGKDNCADNDVVRLGDSVTYNVEISVNDADVENLISTVILDDGVDVKQEWIELPTICETDPTVVSPISQLVDTNGDGVFETMLCNLGSAVEGTNKVFFPAAKVIGKTSSSGTAILNDEVVYATTNAYAVSNTEGISATASAGPVYANVTADFRVDISKELAGKGYDSDGNPIYPSKVAAKGADGTTDGYAVKYNLKITYQQGSMLADDSNGDGTSDYTFIDYFTDDNSNNDGAFSSNIELYTWGPDGAAGGCDFTNPGTHGGGATMTCTQTDTLNDYTGPSYSPDGVNDKNIVIEYENIDPTDPDNDANIVDSYITIWVPETDVTTHQTCGTCSNLTVNQWNAFDTTSGTLEKFVIESTEYNAAGDKLQNYNGAGEPGAFDPANPSASQQDNNNNDTYAMDLTNPGYWSARKSFYGSTSTTSTQPKTGAKGVAPGEIFNFSNTITFNQYVPGNRYGQICDKIDTQNVEFIGMSQTPGYRWVYSYAGTQALTAFNPVLRLRSFEGGPNFTSNQYQSSDADDYADVYTVLYSNEPHATLLEQRDDHCDDDVNGDGVINIKYLDGTGISNPAFPIDWYEDETEVDDGIGGGDAGAKYVSKVRTEFNVDTDYLMSLAEGDTFRTGLINIFFDVQVKDTATGYGTKGYISNYSSQREFAQDDTSNTPWSNNSAYSIDPENIGFSLNTFYHDRVTIQRSGISVGKKTIPEGIKVVRGGDIIEFVLSPQVFGRWSGSREVEINDNLPANTDYIAGTEMFSVDNGATWVDLVTYNANFASGAAGYDVSLISPTSDHGADADPIVWEFGSVDFDTGTDTADKLPLIKYKVLMDPTQTSGNYTNTVTMSSPYLAPRDLRQIIRLPADEDGVSGTINMPYAGFDYTQVEVIIYERIAGHNGSTTGASECRRIDSSTYIGATQAGADGSYSFSSTDYPDIADGTGYCIQYFLPNTKKAVYTLTIVPEFGFDVLKNVSKEVYSVNENFTFDLSYKNLGGEAYTGGEFIDILPFNGDASTTIGGINSVRDPASNFKDDADSYYEFVGATFSNNEDFWVTDEDPTTLNLDPCASSNRPLGYTPTPGDLCYQDYINNGNTLPDGVGMGTYSANWQVCSAGSTSLDVATQCPIAPKDVTAVYFKAPSVPTTGAQTVSLEMNPVGNIGGTPGYTTDPNGLQVVDWDNSPAIGDMYTNSFGGRIPEISLNVISNDVTVTPVSGSIGDYIWLDLNQDGVQDTNEDPIEGIVVELLDGSGNPVYWNPATGYVIDADEPGAVPYVTTTDDDGEYLFDNLPAGDYQIQIIPPAGAIQSYDADGTGTPFISEYSLPFDTDASGNIVGVENNEDQDFGVYAPMPEIELIKYISSINDNGDGVTGPGDVLNYRFTVRNVGNLDISNITLSDTSLPGLTLSGGPIVFMEPGDEDLGTFSATYTLTQADVDNGGVENTATATGLADDGSAGGVTVTDISDTGSNPAGNQVTNPGATETDNPLDENTNSETDPKEDPTTYLTPPRPSWTLDKTTSSTPTEAGQTLDYQFVLTNTGNVTISAIILSDPKCAVGPTLTASTDINADTNLSPTEAWTYTCTSIPVTQTEADAGEVINKAQATGTPANGTLDPVEDMVIKPIGPKPGVKLIKSLSSITDNGDEYMGAGDILNYSFEITNTGNVTLTGVSVTDTSLAGLTLTGTPVATMAPNDVNTTNYTATYTLTQADVDAGGVENTATVTGTDPNGTVVEDISDTGTEPDASSVSNPDASETSNPLDEHPNNERDPTEDPTTYLVVPNPQIELIKTLTRVVDNGDGYTGAGDILEYNFTVTNTGNVTLRDIVVTDTSLPGLTLTGTPITTLAPTAQNTSNYAATYTLTQADVDSGGVENTATVIATDPKGGNVEDTSDTGSDPSGDAVTNPSGTETENPLDEHANDETDGTEDPTTYLTPPTPSWTLDKTTSSAPSFPGDTLEYQFVLTNTGNVTISAITLSDPKCSVGPTLTASTDINADTNLSPTEAWTYTCTSIPVTQAEADAGEVINTAEATGTPANGTLDPVEDMVTKPIGPVPDIKLIKYITDVSDMDGDGMTEAGDVITYGFEITNIGNVTLTNVTVTDDSLSGLNLIGSPIASMETNEVNTTNYTATYKLTQVDINNGGVENTASVSGTDPNDTVVEDISDTGTNPDTSSVSNPDGSETDNPFDENSNDISDPTEDPTTYLVTQVSQLELIKSISSVTDNGDGYIGAGDIVNFSFRVKNIGNTTIQNIIVTDNSLPGINVVGTPIVFLDPEQQNTSNYAATYTLTQADVDAGGVENTATVTGTDPNGTVVEDTSDTGTNPDTSTVDDPTGTETDNTLDEHANDPTDGTEDPTTYLTPPVPSWTLDKTTSSTPTEAGQTLEYQFVLTNTGNVTISAITLSDPKCAVGPTLNSSTDTFDSGTLTPTETWTYTCTSIPVTQAEADAGEVINTAQATGTPANGTLDPVEDMVTKPIGPTPTIKLIKSISGVVDTTGDGVIGAGDTVNYSFEITNTGNVTLAPVTMTDTSLAGLTLVGSPISSMLPNEVNTTNYTATYVLTQDDVNVGGIENTATAVGTDPNGTVVEDISDTGTNPDTSSVSNPDGSETDNPLDENPNDISDPTDDPTTFTIPPTPRIQLYKSGVFNDENGDGGANFGETISYSFVVTNTGNIDVTNLVVTDPLIDVIGGPLPLLRVGETDATTFTGKYSLIQPDVIRGYVENTAVVSGDSIGGPTSDTSDDGDDSEETLDGEGSIDDDPTNDPTVVPFGPEQPNISSSSSSSGGGSSSSSGGGGSSSSGSSSGGSSGGGTSTSSTSSSGGTTLSSSGGSSGSSSSGGSSSTGSSSSSSTSSSSGGDSSSGSSTGGGSSTGSSTSSSSSGNGSNSSSGGSTGSSSTSSSSSSGGLSTSSTSSSGGTGVSSSSNGSSSGGEETPDLTSAPENPQTQNTNTQISENTLRLQEKYALDIQQKAEEYSKMLTQSLVSEGDSEAETAGEGILKALPKVLPKTGTPISERVGTKENPRVDTELPSAEIFRLAGTTNTNIDHWTQVLVNEDRDANKYIVIPSNGLVVPINEFTSDSAEFDTMISGREGNINPSLQTGALEYPGTSTKGYGEVGNKVIFAHSSYWEQAEGRYKTHFQKIIELDVGEEIWIYEKNDLGKYTRHVYTTQKSYNTEPTNTDVLLPGVGKNLTLFTCTPIGGIDGRWVIEAKYVEQSTNNTRSSDLPDIEDFPQADKLLVQRFMTQIRAIENDTRRLETLYKIYAKIDQSFPKYVDSERITKLLQLLRYRIAKEIIEQ